MPICCSLLCLKRLQSPSSRLSFRRLLCSTMLPEQRLPHQASLKDISVSCAATGARSNAYNAGHAFAGLFARRLMTKNGVRGISGNWESSVWYTTHHPGFLLPFVLGEDMFVCPATNIVRIIVLVSKDCTGRKAHSGWWR